MSWNDRLYMYAQERGGEYFGGMAGTWMESEFGSDGVLLLEYRGQPMVVRCDTYQSRYSYTNTARVLLRCELERDYTLSISAKGAVFKGLNTVLGGLDKGAELLNRDVDLYRDYGFPEVTAGRKIKTSDPEFTQMVLRDLELRNVLQANPGFQLRVRKCAPECVSDSRHLILAKCEMGSSTSLEPYQWDIEDVDRDYLTPEQQLAALKGGNFPQKLDALIALAQAAHGAVTAWRMPVKTGEKD